MNRLLKTTIFHVCDPKPLTATSVPDLAGIGTFIEWNVEILVHAAGMCHYSMLLLYKGINAHCLCVKTCKHERQRTWTDSYQIYSHQMSKRQELTAQLLSWWGCRETGHLPVAAWRTKLYNPQRESSNSHQSDRGIYLWSAFLHF